MSNWEQAVERIKRLECPTGEVEKRVAGILAEYGVAAPGEILVHRDEAREPDKGEVYRAEAAGQSLFIYAKSGMDDYVAKVMDVHQG
ncbi:hypothetical protein [Ectobacillus ponti]|uniref:Uncharacterized protein n=1 Tax=Ectobacillus ponti TaxID=2961894 RepID=A0AA41X976_9BACI|nr:hypothetical protein [Ectobacillus ponti]MCP8968618.1 hypothetical protein [Ectobacillus ponti]